MCSVVVDNIKFIFKIRLEKKAVELLVKEYYREICPNSGI